MSTELEALLEAIRESPEDDLPRLALADWCLEQPDPAMQARGEFIQMRCRAALLPPADPRRGILDARAAALRDQHEAAWVEDLAPFLAGAAFDRGMLLIEINPARFRPLALDSMARCRGWRWVIGLRGVLLDHHELYSSVTSRHLAQLAWLDLGDCEVGAEGARQLARSPGTSGLTRLLLGYSRLGDAGALQLALTPHPPRLRMLTLCNNAIGPSGVRALTSSAWLNRLVFLDLGRNPIGDEGARQLAGSSTLGNLHELRLDSCQIGDSGAHALVTSSHLADLRVLDLTGNPLDVATRNELREHFGDRVRL